MRSPALGGWDRRRPLDQEDSVPKARRAATLPATTAVAPESGKQSNPHSRAGRDNGLLESLRCRRHGVQLPCRLATGLLPSDNVRSLISTSSRSSVWLRAPWPLQDRRWRSTTTLKALWSLSSVYPRQELFMHCLSRLREVALG